MSDLLREHAYALCGDRDGPHILRTRGDRRKGFVYRFGTSAEVRVPQGVEPLDHLAAIVGVLLDGGCEIKHVEGVDVDEPIGVGAIDWRAV